MNAKEKKDLALAEILVIVLAVIGLAVVIWLAWLRPSAKSDTISNFDQCAQAGNAILNTYPPQCVTKDGHSFTQQSNNNGQ